MPSAFARTKGAGPRRSPTASDCPARDDVMTLPDDVKAGDTVQYCSQTYRLTFEYVAFAAEEA